MPAAFDRSHIEGVEIFFRCEINQGFFFCGLDGFNEGLGNMIHPEVIEIIYLVSFLIRCPFQGDMAASDQEDAAGRKGLRECAYVFEQRQNHGWCNYP